MASVVQTLQRRRSKLTSEKFKRWKKKVEKKSKVESRGNAWKRRMKEDTKAQRRKKITTE